MVTTRPRSWATAVNKGLPRTARVVRDGQAQLWHRGADGDYHSSDNRQHHTAAELRARGDIEEVIAPQAPTGPWPGVLALAG